ncbi:GGDEF domain-containing protein [Devosia submarina]|uniref:GGDEF domain-containing protein n=1 Tax=Devosia submarina TaxID=1173082 RepID=UPI000D3D2D3F|nr:GGDEF domain-containing protein [Devosia submarina]
MSAAGFVLAINIFVAGLFAAAFGAVAWHSREAIGARWLAIAYGLGIVNAGLELVLPGQSDPRLLTLVVFAVALGAFLACVVGLACHYNKQVPWKTIGALGLVSVALNAAMMDQASSASFERAMVYQLPYFAVHLLGAAIVFRSGRRGPMDVTLLVFFVISGLQFVAKPFMVVSLGGATPDNYLHSLYGAYSQMLTAFLLIANGVLMLLIMVRDELAVLTIRSETDKLSGLWNRRGFEDHSERALVEARRAGVPSALVMADLDRFKRINDTLGHAHGDEVIAAFAGILMDNADKRMVVGRTGGEEFAVFVPGANLPAARLYAEAVRTAFSAKGPCLGVPGLSASFGVVELAEGETLGSAMRRADLALYDAKKKGRDQVSVVADGGVPGRRMGSRGS